MTETGESRLKRLRLRSWRRGTREMDLLLGGFADAALAALPQRDLQDYESLLYENDQDLYCWISGTAAAPTPHAEMVGRIRAFHSIE